MEAAAAAAAAEAAQRSELAAECDAVRAEVEAAREREADLVARLAQGSERLRSKGAQGEGLGVGVRGRG